MTWNGFPEEATQNLNEIIVSHKSKDKLLLQYDIRGISQIKLRGQLHEGTLYGLSNGNEVNRISISKLVGKRFATKKTIEKIINALLKK